MAVARTMQTAAQLKRYLLPLDTIAPLLYGFGASLAELQRPAQTILHSFEPSGRLADDASSELGPLRQRMRAIEESVQDALRSIMESAKVKKILQEPYFTLRAERYVLPVISSFKGQLEGIVHDASNSGQTVFIEPQRIVELGNRLKIAQSEVKEEEFRILSTLTLIVSRHAQDIRDAMVVIGQVDFLSAAAQLTIDMACVDIIPDEDPVIDLIDARHPLLILQKRANPGAPLVANDIGLKSDQQVLILTGPNTGGKTVAMKTVGLLALMLRCGLHIPCDPRSRLGWFDKIEVAIGDEQSIESQLSTFAAHIKNLSRIVDTARRDSLVLIDEIAADTNPTQGQALAQAVLERLAQNGAHVIVTTHFEGLKVIPLVDSSFRNAGVGFDAEAFRPTYHVNLDVPQGSNGFDIARSLGMNEKVISRARDLCGEDSKAIEDLMKVLQGKAADLEAAKIQAERAAVEHTQEQVRLEQERTALKKEREGLHTQAHDALFEEIKSTRNQVRAIIAELQNTVGTDAIRNAMRHATKAAQELTAVEDSALAQAQSKEVNSSSLSAEIPLEVGSWIHVPKLGKDGSIVSFDKKAAIVLVGNMRVRAACGSLEKAKTARPKSLLASAKGKTKLVEKPKSVVAVSSSEEIDLRGLNSDEAIARLDAFLDHHYQGPSDFIRVIHGHGTGALRSALRKHLKLSGYVQSFEAEDEKHGGNGATLVELS